MRPRKDGVRINGPYEHGNQWRVYITATCGGRRTTSRESFTTEALALAWIDGASEQAQGVTVKGAVDEFIEAKRKSGLADTTIENYRFRLVRLVGMDRHGNRPVRYLAGRGGVLYAESVRGAADTHINGLNVGRMFGAWCVEQRYLKRDPFAGVKKVGRKRKGATKPRPSRDERRKIEAYCFAHPSQDTTLTYGYMMIGKRASEIVRLRVRDLDDDGWMVRILDAKSETSIGDVPVPGRLRDMLLELAKGRAADAVLFTRLDGKPMSRYGARDRVRAVTKAAIGREVCPQELRRAFVDESRAQGYTLRTIAEAAGHTSTAVTERSYQSRGAADAAAVERNLKVIAGGKR